MALDYRRAVVARDRARGRRSGGHLAIPRTPVQKIMLLAAEKRRKRQFLARQASP